MYDFNYRDEIFQDSSLLYAFLFISLLYNFFSSLILNEYWCFVCVKRMLCSFLTLLTTTSPTIIKREISYIDDNLQNYCAQINDRRII